MLKLTLLYCIIVGVFCTSVRSISPNDPLFNVNTCDDTTMDGRYITGINSILTQWRVEFRNQFCNRECVENLCECDRMVRYRREPYESFNIDKSLMMEGDMKMDHSEWISVNVCHQPRFEMVLIQMNKMLYRMKKNSYNQLCKLQCETDLCFCHRTTTTIPPPSQPVTTPSYGEVPSATPFVPETPPTIPPPSQPRMDSYGGMDTTIPTLRTTAFTVPPPRDPPMDSYGGIDTTIPTFPTTTFTVPPPSQPVTRSSYGEVPSTTPFIPTTTPTIPPPSQPRMDSYGGMDTTFPTLRTTAFTVPPPRDPPMDSYGGIDTTIPTFPTTAFTVPPPSQTPPSTEYKY